MAPEPSSHAKRVLATFSSRGWERNTARFVREAKAVGAFTHIAAMGEQDVAAEGWPCAHRRSSERGFGYYTWKPVACLRAIREAGMEVSEGTRDVLVWVDAGCTLVNTPSARAKLQAYFERAASHASGWLAFEQTRLRERVWTKSDLFEALGPQARDHAERYQVWAGCFFVRPTPRNVRLLEAWRSLCEQPHLVDDAPSRLRNYAGFREHRHDQSILSLLLRLRGAQTIPDECEAFWALVKLRTRGLPILSTRIRRNDLGPLPGVQLTLTELEMVLPLLYCLLAYVLLRWMMARRLR